MELAASDEASPIPARQFRRRKSLGELVQGIKIKYSREKMTKDSDAGSPKEFRSELYTGVAPFSGHQPPLYQGAFQNRCSLPVPIPERSASITYESLPVSPVSSTPPRLDVLHDFALDDVHRTSTFRDGLEKAVNDINTKYGDSTKTFISSSSPTNSIAFRDRNPFRSRYVVPIYGDTPAPNARPVIGELWTALKSQEGPLQPSKSHEDIPKESSDPASPFHDSHTVDAECSESETISTVMTGAAADDVSTSISQPGGNGSQEKLSAAENADDPADIGLNKGNSHSDTTVPSNADEKTDTVSQDKTANGWTEPDSPAESAHDDSLCSQGSRSTSALSQSMSSDQSFSAAKDIATSKADLEATPRAAGANRGRNSSAPSVAALVSKFRRMQQSPDRDQEADAPEEQDQVSVESNSRFIQSYRQRSEDDDNENSLLSNVSSDNSGNVRLRLAVY